MSVLAYILRHGTTDLSPKHEGQTQIPMNALGKAQVRGAAEFIKWKMPHKPVWGVSSDLLRTEQALAICAEVLNLKCVRPVPELRNLGDDETSAGFEKRLDKAIPAILETGKKTKSIPLIATHRSVTAWTTKKYSGVEQELDYHRAAVIWEGGVIVIDSKGARPIYKPMSENTAEDLGQPDDGTHISGFVTGKDNIPPRECWNCKWMVGMACHHPVVKADDELGLFYGKKRNKEGYWLVDSDDCCNSFQNKVLPVPTVLY
jgi:histidine phosphatase superfamily protein (branch 1)